MNRNLAQLRNAKTLRNSSWDVSGRNADYWVLEPGETRVLADIKGPGAITHLWMTQSNHYREVLLKITWDDADYPSVFCPLGDFFCLGHEIVNSFQSFLFSASTRYNNLQNKGCALNCYAFMPFKKRALVELVNESNDPHKQYFYVDYELYETEKPISEQGYFHAEFRRENPFGGWGHEITVNHPEADIKNKQELAWKNNYVILETKGSGHYIGCNMSITNFQGTWWGEGDDMIWVDGYKWPPDLHGTGSEDYFNQAWGMQPNAFMRNGSSIHEEKTGGYQTSYIFHVENPIRFQKEIKVTIEHGHGNHLRNEVSSVAYWYSKNPVSVKEPPPVMKRLRVEKKDGKWILDPAKQTTSKEIELNDEMKSMKLKWKAKNFPGHVNAKGILSIDDGGTPCLKMHFSPRNPEIYDVPLAEIVDFFIAKQVTVKVWDGNSEQVFAGILDVKAETQLFINQSGPDGTTIMNTIDLKDIIANLIGKEVVLECLLEIEGNEIINDKFVILFQQESKT
ncbi:MAG: glycoside hydrolase family 172 protein [Promethearchaeota archaeon]